MRLGKNICIKYHKEFLPKIQKERLEIGKENTIQHPCSHASVQTIITQGLQIANAPCPCQTGWTQASGEKASRSLCPGSCDVSPDTACIPPAPPGPCLWPMGTQQSLSRPQAHGPTSLLSLTYIRQQPAPLGTIAKEGPEWQCMCVCTCMCTCLSVYPPSIPLLHRPKAHGFFRTQCAALPLSNAGRPCAPIFPAQLF